MSTKIVLRPKKWHYSVSNEFENVMAMKSRFPSERLSEQSSVDKASEMNHSLWFPADSVPCEYMLISTTLMHHAVQFD